MIPEQYRAILYRVLTAAAVVVAFYGWRSEAEVAMWLGVITSIVGNGLASVNTSVKAA
jgi:hypothetical protein